MHCSMVHYLLSLGFILCFAAGSLCSGNIICNSSMQTERLPTTERMGKKSDSSLACVVRVYKASQEASNLGQDATRFC